MTFKVLASLIASQEGKSDQESIGNIRESLKITLSILANLPYSEVAKLLSKYQKQNAKGKTR